MLRPVAAGDDLEGTPAGRHEIGQQLAARTAGQCVSRRVREGRHAAGLADPADHLAERRPLGREMGRLASA